MLFVVVGRQSAGVCVGIVTSVVDCGYGARPFRRVVGADTFTPLAGAAFLVIPSEDDIVAAADSL
jgi:2-oxoisovalerate dehydrogenase E1 component